jgi:polyisoprenoid-binding protein YceI
MFRFAFIGLLVMRMVLPIQSKGQYFTKKGHVEFRSHSTLEDFTGKSDYLTGKINFQDSTVDFYLDLSTLRTGIRLRDEHMHENYLQDDKYPFASFYGKIKNLIDPVDADTQNVLVAGVFKVHGVSRQIQIKGSLIKDKETIKVSANWPLQLQDYKIDIPKFLFLRVNETIHISINAKLDKQLD